MKTRIHHLICLLCVSCLSASAQQFGKLSFGNTIQVETNDSNDRIMEKAAHVIPTANQWSALQNEFIAFVHFGPNTFTQVEWGNGYEDPKVFDLKQLDTDQWCEAMKAAGMKMAVLTAKHHDGFVLWQSRYTTHGVMSSPFREGKGDIMKDLSESCRKYGIKLGVYLSPADLYQIESPEGLYGNLSKYTLRTIPREIPGRPFKNPTRFQFEVDDYNEYFLNQLFELLTEYGPIHEVWFDGAHPKRKGNQQYNYAAWRQLIRTLAPEAVVFGKEDIRWCGNEGGNTRTTEWNVIPYAEDPNTMNNFADLTANDLGSREALYKHPKPYYLHYQPAETNTSIRAGWFYSNDQTQKVRSTDDVFDIYERSVGSNSIFMLNIPPNREGLFPERDVKVLREVGERIRHTYGTNLLHNAKGPKEVLDSKTTTYTLLDKGPREIVLTLPKPVTLNRIVICEAITKYGERVEQHAVDAYIDGRWQEIAQATNIGHKRILRVPEVSTDRLRVRVTACRLSPAISSISAHYYHTRPPMLEARRSMEGYVSIEPLRPDFHWNANQQNSAKNLSSGFKVYYTTDGTEPTPASTEYKEPFRLENGELKAISYLNAEQGALYSERFGLMKQDWKLLSVSSETEKHTAITAFDENPGSYWLTKEEPAPHFISIDLGKVQVLNGFAYTPQRRNGEGMVEEGLFQTSADGITWQEAERFEFGNLINDPTKRFHYFKRPVTTRYIRLEVTRIAGGGKTASIAELDLF